MDKRIILEMQSSKNILISIDGGGSITIPKENRSIRAEDIYQLINFSRGDKYTVESSNEGNLDTPVLKFFEELLIEIVKKLNRIPDSDEDDYLTGTDMVENDT